MKILVTGGGGFLGRVITEQLLKRGDTVRVLGRRDYPCLKEIGVEIVPGDIRDKETVLSAAKGMEALIHAASITDLWGRWEDFYQINVVGTENILSACKKHGISRLVYTSTPSVVHGGQDILNADESIPYPKKYHSFYSETKMMAEKKVLKANGTYGISTVSIRPHLIFGPQDTNLLPRIIARAKAGKLFKVGKGDNMVDIVYVDNAAHAHLLALDRLQPGSTVCGKTYFISQGKPVNLWGWIENLLQNLNLPPIKKTISFKTAWRIGLLNEALYSIFPLSREPLMTRFLAAQLSGSHYFNISNAVKDLNYSPIVSQEEGFKKVIEYYSH